MYTQTSRAYLIASTTSITCLQVWQHVISFLYQYDTRSQSLKGLAKWKFDKENRDTLDAMPEEHTRLRKVIPEGEKITPKAWQAEIDKIIDGQEPIEEKMAGEAYDLAYAEVLQFNKGNEERERNNDISTQRKERERQSIVLTGAIPQKGDQYYYGG